MDINLNTSFDYQSLEFQQYLFKNKNVFKPSHSIPVDFDFDENDARISDDSKQDNVIFLVEEEYVIEKGESRVLGDNPRQCIADGTIEYQGTVKINIVYSHDLDIKLEYLLYLKKNIPLSAGKLAKSLFKQYNRVTHGDNIIKWIESQLRDGLTKDMFIIDTHPTFEKLSDRIEVDASQRESLFRLYCSDEGGLIFDENGERILGYGKWANQENIACRKIGEKLLFGSNQPEESLEVREYPSNTPPSKQELDSITEALINRIIPPTNNCGKMQRYNQKLLQLLEWPEFKIEWKTKRIKIGCSKITISYPVLRIRKSEIVFYAYISVPQNVGVTAFNIAKACAFSSALKGAVIGVVLGNLPLAISTFKISFKDCIEREIKKCIYPGLFTVKEVGSWK
ncbi:hypothetical protein IWQ47_001968 [Aquimarina sp. EL_43]|uniref:hypothetical protein n=1 Tax=unclassified Aquimarina TaxID=2627091 RepID=UPI0018C9590D|nr:MULTISPECIES: hypothetical protein [unclassified Aquimarina]MBG6129949.1 hypothetical protein [Aquimarina sp. EL_35]MBG6148729.1 hypothetical protein [Aquimarina sp. EL_32]MBG6168897.1 hypothetical protein [Aquimarina sp. EL_43]